MSRRIARPYAAALFEVLKREGVPAMRACELELAAVAAVFEKAPELLRVFEVPSVPLGKKRELISEIARGFGVRNESARLLVAMTEHVRLRFLPEIVASFRDLVDRREGVILGRVEGPVALSAEQTQALQAALARTFGARVEFETQMRPELLAGFIVRIGSLILDGSLAAQLRRFAAQTAGRSEKHAHQG